MEDLDLSSYKVQEINLHENDETRALGDKYGIKSVPTIVVADDEGNEIKRIRNIVQLKDFLKNTFIFEDVTEGIETGVVYTVGIDDYKGEPAKTTWVSKIKNIFK